MVEVAQGRLCNLRALLGLGMLIAMNLYACGAVRPNVLIILTDDQGWGDLGIHGNTNLSTPYLDSIAKQGASFLNYYVCQVCAPT